MIGRQKDSITEKYQTNVYAKIFGRRCWRSMVPDFFIIIFLSCSHVHKSRVSSNAHLRLTIIQIRCSLSVVKLLLIASTVNCMRKLMFGHVEKATRRIACTTLGFDCAFDGRHWKYSFRICFLFLTWCRVASAALVEYNLTVTGRQQLRGLTEWRPTVVTLILHDAPWRMLWNYR
jgi:hypothetical protein